MAHVNRKEYGIIFGALTLLTALEVGVVYMHVAHTALVIALVSLALVKAGLVGLFFMHLKYDTKVMKLTVLIPMTFPAIYAFVLIAEAAWRRLPWMP